MSIRFPIYTHTYNTPVHLFVNKSAIRVYLDDQSLFAPQLGKTVYRKQFDSGWKVKKMSMEISLDVILVKRVVMCVCSFSNAILFLVCLLAFLRYCVLIRSLK